MDSITLDPVAIVNALVAIGLPPKWLALVVMFGAVAGHMQALFHAVQLVLGALDKLVRALQKLAEATASKADDAVLARVLHVIGKAHGPLGKLQAFFAAAEKWIPRGSVPAKSGAKSVEPTRIGSASLNAMQSEIEEEVKAAQRERGA